MGSFNYGCASCSFFVMERAVTQKVTEPGMLFTLSPDGKTLTFTCHARTCKVARPTASGFSVSAIGIGESGTVSISEQVAFGVSP